MSCCNSDCLPLVNPRKGLKGDTGATGATGRDGFVIVGVMDTQNVNTNDTIFTTVTTFNVNSGAATGQLLQSGEGYKLIAYVTSTGGTGTSEIEVEVAGHAIGPVVIANTSVNTITIDILRIDSTSLLLAYTILDNTGSVFSYQIVVVADLSTTPFSIIFKTKSPTTASIITDLVVLEFLNRT